jgi:aryl sulfotransferase
MPTAPIRYTSPDDDNARWIGFPFREDDIVIATRSKTGTTWLQMICALLIFQTPELPDSLANLSPWLDWLITPRDDVFAQLAAQRHRRFIKTHTPLDGLPTDARVTYIVTGRHPLDMAVSLYHHAANLNRDRIRELIGRDDPRTKIPEPLPLHEWLIEWIEREVDPRDSLDSLPGVLWHLTDAWQRQASQDVILVHYDDLIRDLEGQMRLVADRLRIAVPEDTWPALVKSASFPQMQAKADSLIPDPSGILKNTATFFRRGTSGAGAETLTPVELVRYYQRTAELAPSDVLAWLHRGADSQYR